jgi:ABC-type nitrate/sulfonate/bicarbonate transport system permease component
VVLRRRLSNRSYGWLGIALCSIVLEVLTRTDLVSSRHFPPPSATWRALVGQLDDASLWIDLRGTLAGWSIGLLVAAAIAVPLGLATGSSELLYRLLRFPIEFVRPIPAVALVPLVVLVLGTGLKSKIFVVALAAVWPLLIQTVYGIQDADPVTTDTAQPA